jgi:thiol-disulfide isomerase/thioredoxin
MATTNAMTAAATITTATPPAFIATNRDDAGNTEYSRGLYGEDAGTSPSSSFSYSGEVVPLSSTQALNRFLKDATTRKGLVCVVAFSSPGCGPCKRLAGPMSKLAQELKEVALFVSVDVTENNNGGDNEEEDDDENGSRPLADVCGVSAVPTFQLYRPVTTHPSSSGSGSGEGAVCEGINLPVPASTLVATKALELRGAECWKVRAAIEKLLE